MLKFCEFCGRNTEHYATDFSVTLNRPTATTGLIDLSGRFDVPKTTRGETPVLRQYQCNVCGTVAIGGESASSGGNPFDQLMRGEG
jgi:hypothetical protein